MNKWILLCALVIIAVMAQDTEQRCFCPCACQTQCPNNNNGNNNNTPRPQASPRPNNNGNNTPNPTGTRPYVAPGKTALLIGQNELPEYISYARSFKAPAGGSFYGTIYANDLGVHMHNYLAHINSTYPGAFMLYGLDAKSSFTHVYGNYDVTKNTEKQWRDILAGTGNIHDNIRSIANHLKSYSALKFLMRIDYEVSGNLHANADTANWNPRTQNAAPYQQAFCRIANIVKEIASNVEFVYHPVRGDYSMLYPGASCVDWIGLSIFNNDLVLPASNGVDWYWNNQTGQVDSNLAAAFAWARNTGKKVMIAESSVQRPYSNDDSQIQEYFNRLMTVITRYNVDMWAYINTDWLALSWPAEWDDSRLETKSEAMQQWWRTNVLNNPRFVHYNN